jgi:hypothetical protein
MPKPPRTDDPDQSQRFIEAARELGCDEDEDAFKNSAQTTRRNEAGTVKLAP